MSVGSAVVLVHGQPGTGADFFELAALLQRDHLVLAPDRPGWGANPRPPVGLAENADALAVVLAEAGATGGVTVLGHSLGGGVALELALRHPSLVAALVLVGSVGVGGALSGVDRLLGVPFVGSGIVRAGVATLRGGVSTASRLTEGRRGSEAVRRVQDLPTVRAVVGEGAGPLTGRARRSFVFEQRALLAETPGLERRLGRVAVPTAVVSGTSDRIVPTASARELAAAIAGAELITMAGGHLLPFDQAPAIAAVVDRYARLRRQA